MCLPKNKITYNLRCQKTVTSSLARLTLGVSFVGVDKTPLQSSLRLGLLETYQLSCFATQFIFLR